MEKSLEDYLLQAIRIEDIDAVAGSLSKGANPNKTLIHGLTCLGEAAKMGKIEILKLLINASKDSNSTIKLVSNSCTRKRSLKCHKRKLKHDEQNDESNIKCKNLNDRVHKDDMESAKPDRNQGYFVFKHNEGSSSDESRTSLKSLWSPTSLTPSPQADLEWDEEIGTVAPTTIEDETWCSMYKWYAAILESSGAAIAAASCVTNGIDQQDTFAKTALHYAAESGYVGAVKVLIEAGCKLDVPASNGLTPLHVAVIKNYLEIVSMFLEAGSNVNYKTHDKMSPLHYAATRGLLDLVKYLVKNGAHLEARDSSERTALYLAAGRGHADVVKHLISCGANVNGEQIHGYTPLCEAVWEKYAPVVEVLLNCGARITHSHRLLHYSISNKQEDIIMLLLRHGGGINLHNDVGDTPLLLAARTSQPKIARILLQKGANVNSINSITGLNALHIAVETEDVDDPELFEELLMCLIEYNIDMNAIALIGDTALNRAILLHKEYAAVLLIRHGADVNACDIHSCGLDNLATASRRRTPNLARMLVKAGHYTFPMDPSALKRDCAIQWVYYASRQPLDLSDLCRIKIRQTCRSGQMFRYIHSLPLPTSLKRFLMMEDEG